MPKKRPAHHPVAQPQRPQPKKKDVVLVRASAATEVAETTEEEAEEQTTTVAIKAEGSKTKPINTSAKVIERPTSTTGRRPEITTKSGAQLSRNLPTAQRGGWPGQRTSQRSGVRMPVGRQANLVSAEHYRYVLKDLRLIAILAAVMFSTIIALTFILPHIVPNWQ